MVVLLSRERVFYFKFSLLFYFCWFVCFAAVGTYANTLPTRDITSSLDNLIPFMPIFVWPYEICYVFPFVPLLVLSDWHRFNRAILAVVIANLTAYAVYFIFPIAFPRPVVGNSISEAVVAFEHSFDFYPGANKLPSLHVAFAWLVYLACRGQLKKRWQGDLLLLTASLITISTVFVKQHILVDSVAGVAWAFGAWGLAKRVYPLVTEPAAEPRAALHRMMRKILPFVFISIAVLFLAADLHWRRIIPW